MAIVKDLCKAHPERIAAPGSGAIIAMIALESSRINDLAELATSALEELTTRAPEQVREERARQSLLQPMISALVRLGGATGPLPSHVEAAFRHVPRGLFLEGASTGMVYTNREVTLPRLGIRVESPEVDLLVLQKLRLSPGQTFLDIGSGSGYLTTLAAYMVGPSGAALGIDISEKAVAYAQVCKYTCAAVCRVLVWFSKLHLYFCETSILYTYIIV